jgi:hypothetical protein
MNERIKELAEQAGMTDDKFGMFFAKDKHDEDGVDLAKFTELIVKECAQYIEDKFDFCGDEIIIAEKLKEQFGVEV